MARVFLIKHSIKLVYSIDQAVGQGCPNRKDDVLLVQFFLRAAMEINKGHGYNPPGEEPIKIDGVFGKQTNTYIKFFEAEGRRKNPSNPITLDGRIDPMSPNSGGRGAITQNTYKIFALNLIYFNRRGLERHLDISNDPLYPFTLYPSLYV